MNLHEDPSRPAQLIAEMPGHVLVVRVAFAGPLPASREQLSRRLERRLRHPALNWWLGDNCLVVLNRDAQITVPARTAFIGWLLVQPEVVFVAREFPVTRRLHDRLH